MSLRKAINAKCRECIYDDLAPGNWRQQVEACPCTDCPLYAVRPRSRGMARVAHLIDQQGADVQREAHGIGQSRQRKAPAATEALKNVTERDDCTSQGRVHG